jgi:sulfonate dioxygenase
MQPIYSYVRWHADQAQERQPPAVSMLVALEVPASGGGDTLFSSTTWAYKMLSPSMQKFLSTLWSVNSSKRIVDNSSQLGGPVRRPPVPVAHPIITVHPTTGEKVAFPLINRSSLLPFYLRK